MGAWIETIHWIEIQGVTGSHPVWVRGLKLTDTLINKGN